MTSLSVSGSAAYCCFTVVTAGLSMSMSSFTPSPLEKSGAFQFLLAVCRSAAARVKCCLVLAHHAAGVTAPAGTDMTFLLDSGSCILLAWLNLKLL